MKNALEKQFPVEFVPKIKAMTPEEYEQEGLKMSDLFVRSGIATGVIFNHKTQKARVDWTSDGIAIRDGLSKAYNKLAEGKGEQGKQDFILLVAFIAQHR